MKVVSKTKTNIEDAVNEIHSCEKIFIVTGFPFLSIEPK